jgi:hypothetical protein
MARTIDTTMAASATTSQDKEKEDKDATENKEKPVENNKQSASPAPPPPPRVNVTSRNRNNTISTVTYQVPSPSGGADALTKLFSPPTSSPTISSPSSNPASPTSPNELNTSGEGLGGSARRFFTLKRGAAGAQPPPQTDLNMEYDNYLAIAKRETFNDVAPLNFMYPSGKIPSLFFTLRVLCLLPPLLFSLLRVVLICEQERMLWGEQS